ncbi:MAG: response regulator [Mycobacteriales bacterium]
MSRLLVIDDEVPFARAMAIGLRARGYEVEWAASGQAGLDLAAREHPNLILLDLGLPDLDGVEVLQALRGWTATPVIVLSARSHEQAKVQALDSGADDYVTKPFGMDELLARVRRALRRGIPVGEQARIVTSHFTVDLVGKRVLGENGRQVHLTPTEWHMVEILSRHVGRLVPQRQLLQEVWGPQYENEIDYLRVYMGRIRRKLEPDAARPRYFVTEPGMGYRLELAEPSLVRNPTGTPPEPGDRLSPGHRLNPETA